MHGASSESDGLLPLILERGTAHGFLSAFALPKQEDPAALKLWELLSGEEQHLGQGFAPKRRVTFAGGRYALRHAINALGQDSSRAILRDDRGAPVLPPDLDLVASISHKDDVVAVLVSDCAPTAQAFTLGVDVEDADAVREELEHLILTPAEVERIRAWDPIDRVLERTLVFSLKESLYKAIDPYVRRFVEFQEVEAFPRSDGTASFLLNLKESDLSLKTEGLWFQVGNHVFTSVRVHRAGLIAPRER